MVFLKSWCQQTEACGGEQQKAGGTEAPRCSLQALSLSSPDLSSEICLCFLQGWQQMLTSPAKTALQQSLLAPWAPSAPPVGSSLGLGLLPSRACSPGSQQQSCLCKEMPRKYLSMVQDSILAGQARGQHHFWPKKLTGAHVGNFWSSLRCDLLYPDILSTPNPPGGCQSCPCCPGRADEVKHPSRAAAPGPAKAVEDLGSSFLGRMKGCSLAHIPHSPLSTGARVWGDKSKLSNSGRGGIWLLYQSQEVFGSEGIGTGRFLILGLSLHRVESALIGTRELLLLELPCSPGKDKAYLCYRKCHVLILTRCYHVCNRRYQTKPRVPLFFFSTFLSTTIHNS